MSTGSETGPDCPESPQDFCSTGVEDWTGLSDISPPELSSRIKTQAISSGEDCGEYNHPVRGWEEKRAPTDA